MNQQSINGIQQEPQFYERALSHKSVSNVQAPEGGFVFRLLSYNLLAKHNEDAVDSFPDGEPVRRTLTSQEILHWDPDIICAQEVCDFSELAGMLAEHG
ncbi:hypothetical protein DUNSADRAFT_3342 [Dunaliella salina]|uniref:Nocturnin n=1 Tax=Dunaliella salina TaxID=3046 RepID=A0ABQ7GU53_DUNSA|nr:hypothetical protein DUNSADRAFT_3342 [Dunaliella salina]|eukprot:KAF5838147.1 hypothetical protein DUNSADRAFT_3342 [Dunaliella salina]